MRVPSISALKALEAVARLGSVNKAAIEVGLTRSAVSHQLRLLEEQLGFPVTVKSGRGIQLTPRGELYARDIRQALALLSQAPTRVADSELAGKIKISCAPGFASYWLCPRIGEFRDNYPFLKLEIVTPKRFDDVSERGVDVFIAFGDGNWSGRWAEPLVEHRFSPVCSPALLNAAGGLNDPDDIAGIPLLHLLDTADWSRWLAAAKTDAVDANRGIVFSDMHLVMAAATSGQGIAIGDPIVSGEALASGRLVRPFALSVRSPKSYFLVTDRKRAASAPVMAFREWIRARLSTSPNWDRGIY